MVEGMELKIPFGGDDRRSSEMGLKMPFGRYDRESSGMGLKMYLEDVDFLRYSYDENSCSCR